MFEPQCLGSCADVDHNMLWRRGVKLPPGQNEVNGFLIVVTVRATVLAARARDAAVAAARPPGRAVAGSMESCDRR